ncbi:MAG TPA: DUF4013 domain-containing protein [Terriglobales bacterium]|nr:DUF4013 domain-containing protein [Terriglobales bacterium]
MDSVGEAFVFPFRGERWLERMVVQALILIIPVVGWIAMTGWMMLVFENARAGRRELPPAGFHLARGIGIFGVFVIYGLVLNVPTWVLYTAGGIASGAASGRGFNVGAPLSALGFIWMWVAGLLLDFLVPSLIVNTYHGGFAGGMDVLRVWRLATVNVGNAVVAGLVVWVASVIGPLGFVLCCVGVFLTTVYQNAVQAGAAAWFEGAQSAPATPPAPATP